MPRSILWSFHAPDTIKYHDSNDSKNDFSFKLIRYKDKDTHKESLKIISLYKDDDNGYIITSVVSLEKDIKKLMDFGVVLSSLEFKDLCMAIEENYLALDKKTISLLEDSRLADLVDQVKSFVSGNEKLITAELCFIPVADFNGLAEDCGYYTYEMKALREQLATDKYIKTSKNTSGTRYAVLERIDDKPQRVIAFYRDKLGVEIPAPKEKKTRSRKSDTDEK